jgi:hypothetical protein
MGGEYYEKYMKYKTKYLELKKQFGGNNVGDNIYLIIEKKFYHITEINKDEYTLSNGQKIYKLDENITWVNNTIPQKNNKIPETYNYSNVKPKDNKDSESDIEG